MGRVNSKRSANTFAIGKLSHFSVLPLQRDLRTTRRTLMSGNLQPLMPAQ
jgi:hypothetical protein